MIWLIVFFVAGLFVGRKLREASDAVNKALNKNPR